MGLRKVSGGLTHPGDTDEVRGGSDGHRPNFSGGPLKGTALPGNRANPGQRKTSPRSDSRKPGATHPLATGLHSLSFPERLHSGRGARIDSCRSLVPRSLTADRHLGTTSAAEEERNSGSRIDPAGEEGRVFRSSPGPDLLPGVGFKTTRLALKRPFEGRNVAGPRDADLELPETRQHPSGLQTHRHLRRRI